METEMTDTDATTETVTRSEEIGYLYHATWPTRFDPITENGLQPGMDGCVYLAGPTPAHAATFIALRGGEFTGYTEIEVDGQTHKLPQFAQHDEIFVIEVPFDALDPALLKESFDHSASFFPEGTESFQYGGEIPYDDEWTVYKFDTPR